MKNVNYFEVIAFYYRGIYDLIKQGQSFKQAEAISFESFWLYPENENQINNLILLVESINVEFSLTKKFRKQAVDLYKKLNGQIAEMDLTKYLTDNELEVFNESIEVLNADLKEYPIV